MTCRAVRIAQFFLPTGLIIYHFDGEICTFNDSLADFDSDATFFNFKGSGAGHTIAALRDMKFGFLLECSEKQFLCFYAS